MAVGRRTLNKLLWIASKQFISFVLSYFTRIGMQFTALANARKNMSLRTLPCILILSQNIMA